MKKSLLILLLLSSFAAVAEVKDTISLKLPVKDSSIVYERVQDAGKLNKDLILKSAVLWASQKSDLTQLFVSNTDIYGGSLIGTGSFVVNSGGLLAAGYIVTYFFQIDTKDGRYRVILNNVKRQLVPDKNYQDTPHEIEPIYFKVVKAKGTKERSEKVFFSNLDDRFNDIIKSLNTTVNKFSNDDF